MRRPRGADPFAALGLPRRAGLTDHEVRVAWRRAAAATHPDRADGGDPARFAAAAAAYMALRTAAGRGETLADVPERRGAGLIARRWTAPARSLPARVRAGRPGRLALRVAGAAAASAAAALAAGWQPATPALITGAITWLVLTARRDLGPPR